MTEPARKRSPLLFRRWTFPGARPRGGGATTDPRTGEQYEKETGYAVGSTQDTAAKARNVGSNRVAHEKAAQQRLARRHGASLRSEGYVGSWRQGREIHYDPSEIVMDYNEAMTKARGKKQLEIYDFKNKRSIPVE